MLYETDRWTGILQHEHKINVVAMRLESAMIDEWLHKTR